VRKKTVSGIMLSLLLIGMLILTFNIQPVKSDWTWTETIYIRADGSIEPSTANITSADNVTYYFTGNINESIVVERDNIVVDGAGYTLQGTGAYESVGIDLTGRSNVTIKNIEIKAFYYGIWLDESSNNTVSGNNITNNSYDGIHLLNASSNTICGNNIAANNVHGIWIGGSSNCNSISGNNITNNIEGIYLSGSSNNTFRNNDVSDNKYNFGVYGSSLLHYIHDIDDSNTVNGKPVYYWVNRRDMTVPLDAGWIALINSTRITIENLDLTNNSKGVLLAHTTNSTITGNNLASNWSGVWLWHSSNNTISGNNITNNGYGINLESSSNNRLVENIITDHYYYGIRLHHSSNNSIAGNNIRNSYTGIYLSSGSNNSIVGNNITNNQGQGICLHSSSSNSISGNNIAHTICGIEIGYSSDNTISGNNVTTNNRQGIYLYYGSSNNTISGNNITNNIEGIYLSGSSNNTISGNTITENKLANLGCGIYLSSSSSNTISGNGITANNREGIYLDYSSSNIVSGNIITNSGWFGIWLYFSSSNIIYHNNFVDNTYQVFSDNSTNVWDDGYPSGGNYWSDHVCTGNPSDGSQPYVIDADNIDNYPFQDPNGWLPPPKPVGGKATPINIPMNKPETPTLWIWLSTIILSLIVTVVYVKKRKRNTEINS